MRPIAKRAPGQVIAALLLGLALAVTGCATPDAPGDGTVGAEPGTDTSEGSEAEDATVDLEPGDEVSIEGIVTANTIDPCRAPDEHDEPCEIGGAERLHLDVDGTEVHVTYFRGEGGDCDNVPMISTGEGTRTGTRVEVFAVVSSDTPPGVDTCPSEDYRITPIG